MPPLRFAIPLRSQQVSNDWARVCGLLEATVRSALSNGDVEVIVACHEIPPVLTASDPRVSFLQAETPIPADPGQQMLDKGHKRNLAIDEVLRRGGGYMMLLDSDDLVSRQIAGYVQKHDNRVGYLARTGYVYDAGRERLRVEPNFDRICGSSAIVYVDKADQTEPEAEPLAALRHLPHGAFRDQWKRDGRPIESLPFPAAMAIKNNGENHSEIRTWNKTVDLRTIVRRAIRDATQFRRPPAAVAHEFGLSPAPGV